MTIVEAGQALRSRQISCLELTNRCLDHIGKLNPRLNAFITVTEQSARARAQELDRDGLGARYAEVSERNRRQIRPQP